MRDNVAIILVFDNGLRRNSVFSAPIEQASRAIGVHAGEIISCLRDVEYRPGGN